METARRTHMVLPILEMVSIIQGGLPIQYPYFPRILGHIFRGAGRRMRMGN